MSAHLLQVVMVALIVSTVDVASAKRGCASFGHSCFGGHGKRSSPDYPDISPASTGEDYFSPGSLAPLPARSDVPFGLKPRVNDYGDMSLDARAPNWTPLWSMLTGNSARLRPEDWASSQRLLLSPIVRQMMRSYRQHQLLKSAK